MGQGLHMDMEVWICGWRLELELFADFFLGPYDGSRFSCLGLKWTSSGKPRNVEKGTKALPFTDSMKTRALVLDFQHLKNSLKVE